MKKITFLIVLLYSVASFSQEQVMLEVDYLLSVNGVGYLTVTNSSGSTLYSSYATTVNDYGQIINLSVSNFPLSITFRPGLNNFDVAVRNHTYSYSDYMSGKLFLGGSAPEYFYIRSSNINQATEAKSPIGICDVINLSGARFYYSTNGTIWNSFSNNTTVESILGSNFRGSIKFKSDIDSYYASPKITMQSKIITVNIIGCPPKFDVNNPPVSKGVSCIYRSDGELTYSFDRPLGAGERFLFAYNIIGSSFVTSTYSDNPALVEVISPLKYKIKKLPAGNYNIKYQTIIGTTTPDPTKYVSAPDFTIPSIEALSFTTTTTQPNCSTERGSVKVTVKGGTSPYYYVLDNQTEVVGGNTIDKKIAIPGNGLIDGLQDGDHTIKIVDSNGCIEN